GATVAIRSRQAGKSASDQSTESMTTGGTLLKKHILDTLTESRDFLGRFMDSDDNIQTVVSAAQVMIETLRNNGTIYSCGNGGSMSDAMHFAEELTGRYRQNRIG